MRILVGVKRVVDYAVKVRIQPDKAGERAQKIDTKSYPTVCCAATFIFQVEPS